MNPTQVFKVARREYLTRVRSRAFIIMTVLVPTLLGGYMFTVPLLMRPAGADRRIAIVDAGTGLAAALADRLRDIKRPHMTVIETATVPTADPGVRERFNASLVDRTLDAYFVLERDGTGSPRVRYFAQEGVGAALARDLRLAVQSTALGRLLAGTGVDADAVRRIQTLDIAVVTVSDRGERAGGALVAMVSTLTMALLLYLAVLINGQGMAMAIVEEKSSRLVEVILGAVTATEFMAGKILGVLGSGLTQLAVWTVVAVLVSVPAIATSAATTGFDLSTVLNARLMTYFVIFFALGYALYSIFFAIIAVTCTSTEEMTQSMMMAVLPMVIAMMVSINVVVNPATPMTRVLSLVPCFTPLVMLARVNVMMPPLWEVWLGIVLLAASSIGVAWFAAKIFRYALLMTGKRPTLPELLAVVRAG